MSFVSDQIRRLDAQLEKLQLIQLSRLPVSKPSSPTADEDDSEYRRTQAAPRERLNQFVLSEHAQSLKRIIQQLGSASQRKPAAWKLVALLQEANIENVSPEFAAGEAEPEHYRYERELEWLVISKAAVQTYGIVLDSLVDQTLPLSEDLFYWDEVLSSYRYTAFYWLQTSPYRLVQTSKEIYAESLRRLEELTESPQFLRRSSSGSSRSDGQLSPQADRPAPEAKESLSETAKKFYGLVKNTLQERAYVYRLSAISPFSYARDEIRQKQSNIRKLREMQASAIGVLLGEGLSFEFDEENDEWRGIIERAVLLMENVLRNVSMVDHSLDEFEETVFIFDGPRKTTDEDGDQSGSESLCISASQGTANARSVTAALSFQLQRILLERLPSQARASKSLIYTHGRPGLVTRYWLPASVLLLSSTAILRYAVNRREAIQTWIREFGATIIDFWSNWVVEPTRKIIGTIRHSEDSEVALVSRKSLAADMDSLERMVVDFAIDHPDSATMPPPLSDADIELIRQNAKEGDLTPVLKAYESALRHPFRGAVRGELIRALLIQIQKTKVDVEVAISGIDRLLKSQELVFGFVGLTPGLLVTIFTARWINSLFGPGQKTSGKKKGQMVRRLRNADKILTASAGMRGENGGCLDYKEHGLLLCEVHVLRQDVRKVLQSDILGEFTQDLEELVDVRIGVKRQIRVVDRIRWRAAPTSCP